MNVREIRDFIKMISRSPGSIINPNTNKNFTKVEFEDFFFEEFDVEIMDEGYQKHGTSIRNMLRTFLEYAEEEQTELLVKLLTK